MKANRKRFGFFAMLFCVALAVISVIIAYLPFELEWPTQSEPIEINDTLGSANWYNR